MSTNLNDPILDEMIRHREELLEKGDSLNQQIESGGGGVGEDQLFKGKTAMKRLERMKNPD